MGLIDGQTIVRLLCMCVRAASTGNPKGSVEGRDKHPFRSADMELSMFPPSERPIDDQTGKYGIQKKFNTYTYKHGNVHLKLCIFDYE